MPTSSLPLAVYSQNINIIILEFIAVNNFLSHFCHKKSLANDQLGKQSHLEYCSIAIFT
jgi:hypothetical protein